MRVTHTFRAQGRCPVNGQRDHYGIEVTCATLITVERILEAANTILAEPIFQEDFTQRLADVLGCGVVTECRHKGDVVTKCECEPEQRKPNEGV